MDRIKQVESHGTNDAARLVSDVAHFVNLAQKKVRNVVASR